MDLLDDDPLFALHLLLRESCVQKEIGKKLKCFGGMIARCFGVKAGHILAREGIDLRAERIKRVGELERGARRRPLEEHVLDEMGNSVLFIRFICGARSNEYAHGDGQQSLHLLDNDANAVRKCLCANHIVLLVLLCS